MRNMSFFYTELQIRNESKCVTRRLGWKFLKPGDRVMAVVKCQGLRKGEKIEKIRPLEIIHVSREPLSMINSNEITLEGFPGLAPEFFIRMFCSMNKCRRYKIVTRIVFKYI